MQKVMLEQKGMIEGLSKAEENQQTIEIVQDRLKTSQGIPPTCFKFHPSLMLWK
jgi:hypothetical protein